MRLWELCVLGSFVDVALLSMLIYMLYFNILY